jgi:hypothetical protein
MTDDQELSLILDRWFADGPAEMPDRVIDVVAAGIARQRQRPAWRLHPRYAQMSSNVKILAAIAAVMVVAVIGYNLLPGTSGGIGGPAPTATPTAAPTPTPSVAPSAAPVDPVMPEGSLLAGSYQTNPFTSTPGLTVGFIAPAGWEGFQNWAILGPNGTGAPDGIGLGLLIGSGIFSDPCHWDALGDGSWPQSGDIAAGPTVDDLVSALHANTAYTSSTPVDITIDGYHGKQLDLQQPSDVDLSTCDKPTGDASGRYFVFGGSDGGLYSQGPGNRWHLRILDVAGTRVIVSVGDYAGTPAADRAAAQAIVDSMTFTP